MKRSTRNGRRSAKKIIFLDIDGVLNCATTRNPRKLPYVVDGRLLAKLKRILAETGAQVVLSSTWRYDPAGLFAARHWGVPFADVTPDRPKSPRRSEILAWVKKHPGVTRFAVIDDEDDELDELPLFQPLARVGLTAKIGLGVVRYLNGETDHDMRANRVMRILQNVGSTLRGHPG